MNTDRTPRDDRGERSAPPRRRPPLLSALAVLLWAETVLVAGVAAWLLIELLTTRPSSFGGGLAIFALAVIAAASLGVTAFGALRARPWIRGASVTWQIVQIAVAVGLFQGADARPGLAGALLLPAVVGIVLALAPSVIAATARTTSGPPAGGSQGR